MSKSKLFQALNSRFFDELISGATERCVDKVRNEAMSSFINPKSCINGPVLYGEGGPSNRDGFPIGMRVRVEPEVFALMRLEKSFHARYKSFHGEGRPLEAKTAKRAWLDVKKAMRELNL